MSEFGAIVTGQRLSIGRPQHLPEPASPRSALETSRPGLFAAGDVRSGSTKRVASAVGEGAMTVHLVHERMHFG